MTVTLEGTRPILIELQALVAPSALDNPRRVVSGVDLNRIHLLAPCSRSGRVCRWAARTSSSNVVGGLRVDEPAIDLALALAIGSSLKERPVDLRTVAIGEIGLSGEIRAISQLERRLAKRNALVSAGDRASDAGSALRRLAIGHRGCPGADRPRSDKCRAQRVDSGRRGQQLIRQSGCGIQSAESGCGFGHRCRRSRIAQQVGDFPQQTLGRGVFLHRAGRRRPICQGAGIDDLLSAAAEGQRDHDGSFAERAQLCDGSRPRARYDQIGHGVDIGDLPANEFGRDVPGLVSCSRERLLERSQLGEVGVRRRWAGLMEDLRVSKELGRIALIRWLSGEAPRAPPVTNRTG